MRTAVLTCVLALACAAPALAQDPAPTPTPTPTPSPEPERRIAPGVKAGHVDVGGLLVEEAAAKLEQVLGPALLEPVTVKVARRKFTLRPRAVKLAFDAAGTAEDAYVAGQGTSPESDPTHPGVDVPLRVRFSKRLVRRWTDGVDRAVRVAPRNATVRFTLRRMRIKGSRKGLDLEQKEVNPALFAALGDPSLKRRIKPGRRKLDAKIEVADLRRRHPSVVTIHRYGFRLRLFRNLRYSKSYGIAVGAVGYDTPTGLFRIQNKAVNPVWNAPNKPWAGEFAGSSVPGGSSANPLKARWLGIVNGVGIHGTSAEYSIGTRASHGCIRMRVADVIDLYPRVPVGTPVLIK